MAPNYLNLCQHVKIIVYSNNGTRNHVVVTYFPTNFKVICSKKVLLSSDDRNSERFSLLINFLIFLA